MELPQLVERLHANGSAAVGDFSQEELETVIDDLPLALESESIRQHLPELVSRIDRRLERTFHRIIEIARQDEDRVGLLIHALLMLKWRGTPTEDQFAWLVQQMSRHPDSAARLAAYERAANLTLHTAQVAILDALGAIHPDEAVRHADKRRREMATSAPPPAPTTAELVSSQEAAHREEMTPQPPPPSPLSPEAENGAVMTAEDLAAEFAAADEAESFGAVTDPGPIPEADPASGDTPTQGPPPVVASWEDPGKTAVSIQALPPEEDSAVEATSDDVPITDEPSRDEAVIEETATPPPAPASPEAPVFDESAAPNETWNQAPEKEPDRLTVRTLLRSLEPADNLAARRVDEPAANGNGNGNAAHTDDEPTVADEEEPTPHVENSLSGEEESAAVADESSSPEAAAAAATPEPPKKDPITVRTLLAQLDSVMLSNSPEEAGAPAEPVAVIEESPEVWDESQKEPEKVTVMTMLRSLETVRVKMQALEETPPVPAQDGVDAPPTPAGTPGPSASESNGGSAAASASGFAPPPTAPPPPKEPKPWSDVDLKPLSPPDRARRLAKVRRALETPELRRGYLGWLFDREKDAFSVVSVRKEILEFGFERATFLAFDDATRGKLARWIRERTAADQVAPAAVLAALRRATWTEGEPPQVDDKTRPIVDAATGALTRVPSEERAALFNRDFTAWLFSIREWEDRETLDRYARDPHPGVSEGLFRALAAMDGLSARFGGSGGDTALQIALGIWDRTDNEARTELAKAIAAGWSQGLVLDRRSFFDAFWQRYQQHEAQRPAILIALGSFEKEIDAAHAKAAGAAGFAPPPQAAPAQVKEMPSTSAKADAPSPARPVIAPRADVTRPSIPNPDVALPPPAKPESTPSRGTKTPFADPPQTPSKGTPKPAVAKEPAAREGTPARGTKTPFADPPQTPSKGTPKPPVPPPPAGDRAKRPTFSTPPSEAPVAEKTARSPAQAAPAAEPIAEKTKTSPAKEPPKKPPDTAVEEDEATGRFFRMMRKNMEAGMRAATPEKPPVKESSLSDSADDIDVPEGDAVDSVLPDEGDAILESSGPKTPASASKFDPNATSREPPPLPPSERAPGRPAAPPPPPAPAKAGAADTRDDEVVLPNEPLRTLADYTRFLKSLSAGRPIDELLSTHGMDYKQYAACMTAWGRLLQNRPDLALRMGQLLRAAG